MLGEFNLYVTSVTNTGLHISFHAQLNADKFTALDSLITQNQGFFEQAKLSSPYELRPGEVVLVKSGSGGGQEKWHRARVVGLQGIEFGTFSVEYIDYGTSELAHFSQVCAGHSAVISHILAQPALAVPCVLAEVVPALGAWSDAAFSYAESQLRAHRPIQAQLVHQDSDGVWHVRVFTGDGNTLASQLAALGLGRLTTPSGRQFPPAVTAAAAAEPAPAAGTAFASRVNELTSVPPPPGSEALVTICHYISGPTKFAIQLHDQKAVLQQLMTEIQTYCQSSPAVPLSAVESGVICLGTSATREGRFLRGVITQADGNVVKVYWADYGNDETKVASELRAMPRRFAQLRIQASRVSLAGLGALTPVQGRPEPLFRQLTEGSVLTGRFAKPCEQPAAGGGGSVCLNQVELLDMGVSVLDLLIRAGVYERRPGSSTSNTPAPPARVPPTPPPSEPVSPPPLTPGTHAEVRVVSVTSVSSLHVRPLETEPLLQQKLARMTDALNVSACPLMGDKAAEGVVCAAFKDASYQRARIVSVGRRDLKVLYIDLGTSEIIPSGAAFALEPALASHPPHAVHCCLSGLEMSHGTPELVERLRALTASGRLLCEVLDQLGEKRIVRLTDLTRQPPVDVGAVLKELMAAGRRLPAAGRGGHSPGKAPPAAGRTALSPLKIAPPATGRGVLSPDKKAPSAVGRGALSPVKKAPLLPLPAAGVTVSPPEVELGRAELISVVHAESASSFFGQLLSTDAEAMYRMEEAMQTRYSGAAQTPLRPAAVGAFCVAQSAINETFYRAKVLSIAGGQVAVQYIDYGDTESKPPTEVFPLLPEFSTLPQLGLFCCLAGGEAVPSDLFCELVCEQTLEIVPVFGSGDQYRVSLPASESNRQLLAQLREFGVTSGTGAKSPASARRAVAAAETPATPVSPAAPSASPAPAAASVDVESIQMPVGLFKDVCMAHVVTPSEFYIRLREHSDALARLEAEMATYGAAPPAPVALRQTVAVETGEMWRRGRVTERKVDQVSVYLLDSGETAAVPLSSVRPLLSQHASLPAQAVRCLAKGVRPANASGWTEEETAKFRSGVRGGSFLARAEEVRGGTAVVTLAQAEPVKPGLLLAAAPAGRNTQQRQADSNNNTSKRSPPPRADMDVLQAMLRTLSCSKDVGGRGTESKLNILDQIIKDPNWRDKATSVPPSAASKPSSWRTGDSQPNGGLRAAERRPSGGSAPAQPAARPPRPDPDRRAAPTAPRGDTEPEPTLDRFAGKMRMDNPAEYARQATPTSGWGDSSSNSRPSSRANNTDDRGAGDSNKPSTPAPTKPPAPTPARVEIPAHSATLSRRPVPPGAPLPVTPTWVAGLGRFYVQRRPPETAFTALMGEMQRFYGGLRQEDGLESSPEPGKPVAAKFTDGGWYRAAVRSVTPAELRVLFVDYGNCEMVARPLVKRLKEEHCRLPAQAYCCQFAGVQPAGGQWKPLDDRRLAKYFTGDMTVTAVDGGSGSVSCVEVTLAGQKVTDLLVADGLAVRPEPSQTVSQQHLGPFPGLSDRFRSGQKVAVFVSYVAGPDHIFCQLSSSAAAIEQMEAEIETAAQNGKPLGGASAGAGCLAPFDGTFYRGAVVELTGTDVAAVYFVDYGNTETVSAAELLECPECLRRLPAQAVRLCLSGVPADHTEELTARADQMEFVARLDAVSTDHLDVTLFDGATNINRELGAGAAPAPAAPVKRVTFSETPAERRPVSVSFTVSPGEFYVQEAAAADRLDELMIQLDAEYSALPEGERAVKEVQPGDLLAAPFSEDGAFYRARVLSCSDPTQLRLHFTDYGNSELSPLSACRQLSPALRAPAAFARRCRLAGAAAPQAGWTPEAAAALEALTGAPEGEVQMQEVRPEGEGWVVRLTGVGGEDVSEELVKRGLAVAETAGEIAKPTEESKPTEDDAKQTQDYVQQTTKDDTQQSNGDVQQTKDDTRQAKEDAQEPTAASQAASEAAGPPEPAVVGAASLTVGRPVAAAVAFSLGPCEFWAQLLADSARLDSLMKALEAAASLEASGELPAAESPSAGTLLAVRYSEDGALYRARLLSDSSEPAESRRVLFIDYGNTESVPATELRRLPAALASGPALAVRCSLALRPAEGAAERFAQLADGELELEMTVLREGDPVIVALTHDGRDLAQTMIEEGLATAGPVDAETEVEKSEAELKTGTTAEDPQRGTVEVSRTSPDEQTDDYKQAKVDDTQAIETEDSGGHEVFISHVNSPLEFFVQSPNTTELDSVMEQLAAAGDSLSPLDSSPSPSDLLAAPFSEDGALYRARILSSSDDLARVLFVDYGNGEEVSLSALRRLPEALQRLPPQALRCRLAVEACAPAAGGRLTELAEEGVMMRQLAVSADGGGPVAVVGLVAAGEDVAETLTAAGLCRPARRLALPPALPPPLGTDLAVRVTHVEDSGEVYVVPEADQTALNELQDMAAELYTAQKPPPPLAAPAAGDLCMAQTPAGAWHRAAVLSVDPRGSACLRLVDCGASLQAPLTQLRQPLQALALPPPLAHRCRLAPGAALDRVREADRRGSAVTVRLTAEAAQLVMEIPDDVTTETTLTDEAEKETPVQLTETSELVIEVTENTTETGDGATHGAPVSPAAAAPSPGRLSREDKIVPGQISYSLIVPPQSDQDPASEPATDRQTEPPSSPTGAAGRQPGGTAEVAAGAAAPAPGTPSGAVLGRHISHEHKIVPGQISFSLLSEPEPEPEPESEEGAPGEAVAQMEAEAGRDTVEENTPVGAVETSAEEATEAGTATKTGPDEDATIESGKATTESHHETTKSAEATTKTGEATEQSAKVTTESANKTIESDKVTTESAEATTESAEMTTESAEVTTGSAEATTESAEVTTGSTEATTESAEVTTGSAEATTESAEVTFESAEVTTESAEATTESAEVTTGSTEATTESAEVTTGSAEATTESAEVTFESAEVTTESAEATTESSETTTESAEVTFESTEVTTESAEATTESAELTTESAEATAESAEAAVESADASTKSAEATNDSAEAAVESVEATAETVNAAAEATTKSGGESATRTNQQTITKPNEDSAPISKKQVTVKPVEDVVQESELATAELPSLAVKTEETRDTSEAETKAATGTESTAPLKVNIAITSIRNRKLTDSVTETLQILPEPAAQTAVETTETAAAAVLRAAADAVTVSCAATEPAAPAGARRWEQRQKVAPDRLFVIAEAPEQDELSAETLGACEETVESSEKTVKPLKEPVKPSEEFVKPPEEPVRPLEEPTVKEPAQPGEEPATLGEKPVVAVEDLTQPDEELTVTVEGLVKVVEKLTVTVEKYAQPKEELTITVEELTQPEEELVTLEEKLTITEEQPAQLEGNLVKPVEELTGTVEELAQSEEKPVKIEENPLITREQPAQLKKESVKTEEEFTVTVQELPQPEEEEMRLEEKLTVTVEQPALWKGESVPLEEELTPTVEELAQSEEELIVTVDVAAHSKDESVTLEEESSVSVAEPAQPEGESVKREEKLILKPAQPEEQPVRTEKELSVTVEPTQYKEEAMELEEEPMIAVEELAQPKEELTRTMKELTQPRGELVMCEEKLALSVEEAAQPARDPAKPAEEPTRSTEEPTPTEVPGKTAEEFTATKQESQQQTEEPAKSAEGLTISEESSEPSKKSMSPVGELSITGDEPSHSSEGPVKPAQKAAVTPERTSRPTEQQVKRPKKSAISPEQEPSSPRQEAAPVPTPEQARLERTGAGDAPSELAKPSEVAPRSGGSSVSDSGDAD